MNNVLGMHYIAEFYNCDNTVIHDLEQLQMIMLEAVRLSGAAIIKHFFHEFSPHGISGMIIIAESHCAMHTWPEHDYVAVDLFSCGDFDYKKALAYIKSGLKCGKSLFSSIKRGQVGNISSENQTVFAEPFEL